MVVSFLHTVKVTSQSSLLKQFRVGSCFFSIDVSIDDEFIALPIRPINISECKLVGY